MILVRVSLAQARGSSPVFPGRPTVEFPLPIRGLCLQMLLVMRAIRCGRVIMYPGQYTSPPLPLVAREFRYSAPLTAAQPLLRRLTAGRGLAAVTFWTRIGTQWTTSPAQVTE